MKISEVQPSKDHVVGLLKDKKWKVHGDFEDRGGRIEEYSLWVPYSKLFKALVCVSKKDYDGAAEAFGHEHIEESMALSSLTTLTPIEAKRALRAMGNNQGFHATGDEGTTGFGPTFKIAKEMYQESLPEDWEDEDEDWYDE